MAPIRNEETVAENIVRRELKSGRTVYKVRYRDTSGDRRSKTFDRKEDAERFLVKARADVQRGEWIDPALGQTTVGEWAERWLASKRRIRPRTRASYESIISCHIVPAFGDIPLARLDRLAVEEWISGLVADELSPSTVRKAHKCLSAMLNSAVDNLYLVRNPATRVELPKLERPERNFLSMEEVERLAEEMREPYRTLTYVLAYGGLRWGEAIALRRRRCDLLRRRLLVEEAASDVSGTITFGDTKNSKARMVSLPAFVVESLARVMEDVPTDPDALVFTSPNGKVLRYSNFRRNDWDPARERAGFPDVTPHALRHSCASIMRAMGADAKAIQSQLGHSSVQVTLDIYTHLFEGDLDDVMAKLDAQHRGKLRRLG